MLIFVARPLAVWLCLLAVPLHAARDRVHRLGRPARRGADRAGAVPADGRHAAGRAAVQRRLRRRAGSLLMQGSTIGLVARRLGVAMPDPDDEPRAACGVPRLRSSTRPRRSARSASSTACRRPPMRRCRSADWMAARCSARRWPATACAWDRQRWSCANSPTGASAASAWASNRPDPRRTANESIATPAGVAADDAHRLRGRRARHARSRAARRTSLRAAGRRHGARAGAERHAGRRRCRLAGEPRPTACSTSPRTT